MSFMQPFEMTESAAGAVAGARADLLSKSAEGLTKESADQKDEKIWKVACGFEEIFVHMMLKQMRKTTWDSGLMDGGNESQLYKDMFDSEVAALSSKSRDLGLSKMIHDYLADRIEGTKETGQEMSDAPDTAARPGPASVARHYESVKKTANSQSLE